VLYVSDAVDPSTRPHLPAWLTSVYHSHADTSYPTGQFLRARGERQVIARTLARPTNHTLLHRCVDKRLLLYMCQYTAWQVMRRCLRRLRRLPTFSAVVCRVQSLQDLAVYATQCRRAAGRQKTCIPNMHLLDECACVHYCSSPASGVAFCSAPPPSSIGLAAAFFSPPGCDPSKYPPHDFDLPGVHF
jgi:hypothetical protein